MKPNPEGAGAELLLADSAKAEAHQRKNCLTCRNFRTKHGGRFIYCPVHPRISIEVALWNEKDFGKAQRRAEGCHQHDDMRPLYGG